MNWSLSKGRQCLIADHFYFSQVISGTSTTLILSLNHASPDVRVLGIQHLKERVEAGDVLEEFCIESLMQRLHDDKIGVINQTLGIGEVIIFFFLILNVPCKFLAFVVYYLFLNKEAASS